MIECYIPASARLFGEYTYFWGNSNFIVAPGRGKDLRARPELFLKKKDAGKTFLARLIAKKVGGPPQLFWRRDESQKINRNDSEQERELKSKTFPHGFSGNYAYLGNEPWMTKKDLWTLLLVEPAEHVFGSSSQEFMLAEMIRADGDTVNAARNGVARYALTQLVARFAWAPELID